MFDPNKNEYIIKIKGTQFLDGESDTIELTTFATYRKVNDNKKLIRYKERDFDSDNSYTSNIIKIEGDNKITLIKYLQDKRSDLILELGKRHQTLYATPAGSLSIGVYTDSLSHEIDENGGHIEIDYTIDFNSDFQSAHHLEIVLEKKEN